MLKVSTAEKNAKKNILFSGVGYLLPLLAALVTIPVMVLKLGVDLYGLYIICVSLIGFMVLVDFGIGQTLIKYVAEYEATGKQAQVQSVLGVALAVYLLIGTLTALLLYGFAPTLAGLLYREDATQQVLASEVLRLTAIPLFLSYVNQFFLNVCKAYHRFDLPAFIHNAANLGGIVSAAVLLLLGLGLVEIIWGYVWVQFAALLFGYLACRRVLPSGVGLSPRFDRQVLREILNFSVFTFLGNLVTSFTTRADKLLIGSLLGTEAVTYYQVPYTIAQMANGIVHTLVQIAFPRFSEMVAVGNQAGLRRLYARVGELMGLLSMVIAVLLIAVGGEFLALWISPEFAQQAGVILQIIALYFFVHSNTVTGYWVLQAHGQARLTALIAVVGALAYFAGMAYFASEYGMQAAAWSLFFLLLLVPLQYVWIARHVGHSLTAYLLQFLLLCASGCALVYLLVFSSSWFNDRMLSILWGGLLGLLVLGGGGYWLLHRRGGWLATRAT